RLHGPYSVWELGDRPQKLRAEIETARAKLRKTNIPPAPPTAVVRNTPTPTATPNITQAGFNPAKANDTGSRTATVPSTSAATVISPPSPYQPKAGDVPVVQANPPPRTDTQPTPPPVAPTPATPPPTSQAAKAPPVQ